MKRSRSEEVGAAWRAGERERQAEEPLEARQRGADPRRPAPSERPPHMLAIISG